MRAPLGIARPDSSARLLSQHLAWWCILHLWATPQSKLDALRTGRRPSGVHPKWLISLYAPLVSLAWGQEPASRSPEALSHPSLMSGTDRGQVKALARYESRNSVGEPLWVRRRWDHSSARDARLEDPRSRSADYAIWASLKRVLSIGYCGGPRSQLKEIDNGLQRCVVRKPACLSQCRIPHRNCSVRHFVPWTITPHQ